MYLCPVGNGMTATDWYRGFLADFQITFGSVHASSGRHEPVEIILPGCV